MVRSECAEFDELKTNAGFLDCSYHRKEAHEDPFSTSEWTISKTTFRWLPNHGVNELKPALPAFLVDVYRLTPQCGSYSVNIFSKQLHKLNGMP